MQPLDSSLWTPQFEGLEAWIWGEQPTSLMGRHVEAGHKGIKHTPSFAKMTSRPGSAPPASAPPHPLQGGPVPPVPEAEVQVGGKLEKVVCAESLVCAEEGILINRVVCADSLVCTSQRHPNQDN
eukprot:scaffold205153_cov21-Tisochrysis_lutea.AAC.4